MDVFVHSRWKGKTANNRFKNTHGRRRLCVVYVTAALFASQSLFSNYVKRSLIKCKVPNMKDSALILLWLMDTGPLRVCIKWIWKYNKISRCKYICGTYKVYVHDIHRGIPNLVCLPFLVKHVIKWNLFEGSGKSAMQIW